LLNKPGALNSITTLEYGRDDYIIHYADEFRDEQLPSYRLAIPVVDHTIFNRKGAARKRDGYLLYSVRHKPDLDQVPHWLTHTLWFVEAVHGSTARWRTSIGRAKH
jgi:hypothetical protein